MGLEIERKFLLANTDWKSDAGKGKQIKQGYLNSETERTVRVRIIGETGILTIKGENKGLTRPEFEYEIPLSDAKELMLLCELPIIEKTRYEIHIDKHIWEIDEFEGINQGLLIAEIELTDENEAFAIPKWIGKEVSSDAKYYNSALIQNPFTEW